MCRTGGVAGPAAWHLMIRDWPVDRGRRRNSCYTKQGDAPTAPFDSVVEAVPQAANRVAEGHVAQIIRYSISCPQCKATIAASWDDADGVYLSLPDRFQCRHCGAVISLTEEQRRTRDIARAAAVPRRIALLILIVATLASLGVASFLADLRRARPVDLWLVIGGCVVAGLVLTGMTVSIYEAYKKGKIRKAMRSTAANQ